MPFLPVRPDDPDAVAVSVALRNAARAVDDPTTPPDLVELDAKWLRYGWDLEPALRWLYVPDGAEEAVGVLQLSVPERDNRHLVWAEITVAPQYRRRGHGTAIVAELVRRTADLGRTTIWLGCAGDDAGAAAFVQRFGFRAASRDARRRQRLADVDPTAVQQLWDAAVTAAADYRVERLLSPVSDQVLADLVGVTAAINDAPMGELTYEDDVIDVPRLRAMQDARTGIGERMYRVVARHRATGEAAGHTVLVVYPGRPTLGYQGDTAVARQHRGHRLGALVKIDMMRWLAEVEPALQTIETFNNAANDYMIDVNEALGYRLSRYFDLWELTVTAGAGPAADAVAAAVGGR